MALAPPVAAAVEAVYAAFAAYRLHGDVEGCPHCVDDDDHRALRAAPLPHMSAAALARFSWKALTTWGTVDDFRHFLPRLLELVVRGEESPIDVDVLFGKLPCGQWQTWPATERAAIDLLLLAWWREDGSVSRLQTLAATEAPLAPYLATLTTPGIVELVLEHEAALWRHGRIDARRLTEPQCDELTAWLLAPALTARLEAAFFAATRDFEAAELSRALEALHAAARAKRAE